MFTNFLILVNVFPNVLMPAKTISAKMEFPYLPTAAKVNVDFVICVELLPRKFQNVSLIVPLESLLVWKLVKRARLFASLVESYKSFF